MPDRRSYVLVVLAVLAVGAVSRAVPLYWSPLPATLDGLRYAALAADATAHGHLPFARVDADELVFTALLAVASEVTGRTPLRLAQPLVVVTGASGAVMAVALVRRAGREWGVGPSSPYLRVGAALAGLTLAVDGLYLRRTGVPDEEAFGLVLVVLLALAAHRLLATRRPAWGVVAGVLLVVFPPLHNLSAFVGALTLTALLAVHLVQRPDRGSAILGLGLVGGFWTYFFGFFEVAARLGMRITYSGLVRQYPGLLLAWVAVLVVGVVWVGGTRPGLRTGAVALPVVGAFAVVAANALVPVYPGTIETPPLLLAMLLGFVVPVVLAGVAAPMLSSDRPTGVLLLALLAAPVVTVLYALTGALTPAFFGAVIRIQTFGHLPVFVLAGLATAGILGRHRANPPLPAWVPGVRLVGTVVVALLLASATLTAPLAYLDLDTMHYPSTVTTAEFQAATFATTRVPGPYATDRNQARIAGNYYDGPGRPVVSPTRAWLAGGPRPACPVLARRGWTTTGAHFYPTGPQTLAHRDYAAFLATRNLVYTSNGLDPFALTRPTADRASRC